MNKTENRQVFGFKLTGTLEEQIHQMLVLVLHNTLATRAKLDAFITQTQCEIAKLYHPDDPDLQREYGVNLGRNFSSLLAEQQEYLAGEIAAGRFPAN